MSRLPSGEVGQRQNNRLGDNIVVGRRVWDVENQFRVRLGPMSYEEFHRFSPSCDALEPICQMVRRYVGVQFDFAVQPVLRADEVPPCRLGGDPTEPSRLGWNTWVRSGPLDHDADDALFSLN